MKTITQYINESFINESSNIKWTLLYKSKDSSKAETLVNPNNKNQQIILTYDHIYSKKWSVEAFNGDKSIETQFKFNTKTEAKKFAIDWHNKLN